MKIYLNSPKENWIVDRFVHEWKKHNKPITTRFIRFADIVWIISPWTWEKLPKDFLKSKKVIVTIHHIDDQKFNLKEFKKLDLYTDYYHVISKKTEKKLQNLTDKKIFYSPFWIDSKKWYEIKNKSNLRRKYNFDDESFLIGSFQRDTEADRKTPKLEKGPDNLMKILLDYQKKHKNLKVILAGNRRDYLIKELNENNISYSYFKMVEVKSLNELYNVLDLYIVSSRVEGGPQAILECASSKTPLISTDVGVAGEILSSESIFMMNNYLEAKPNVDYAYEKVTKHFIPNGFNNFLVNFKDIYED